MAIDRKRGRGLALASATAMVAALSGPALAAPPDHARSGERPGHAQAGPPDHAPGGPPAHARTGARGGPAPLDIDIDEVWDHLEAFQAIADEHADTGYRASGTPGYDASVAYVVAELEEAGLDVWTQEFAFDFYEQLEPTEVELIGDRELVEGEDFLTMEYSGSGDATGPVVAVDIDLAAGGANTSGCEAEDFADFADGAIALMQRGSCAFGVKAQNAADAGASGAIIFNSGDEGATDVFAGTLGDFRPGIPVIGTSTALGTELAEDEPEMRMAASTFTETRTTANVFAETTAGRSDRVLMVGAHLDSVTEGPGINDNATGSAGILEVAKELNQRRDLKNTVRFAFWGAEENGLVGSWHYVDDLAENDPDELERIFGYLNFDMIGSPNYIIGVYDADESTYQAPVPVPPGSEVLERAFTDHFDANDQPWVDTEFSGRSDYQGFIAYGIPASGLFTGADDVKTEEEAALFGGTVGDQHDPNYHTIDDDIDNVDRDALGIMVDAIASAVLQLSRDPRPLEVQGDRPECPGRSCEAPGRMR